MVIELGPGTGAFTRLIRERLNPATTFIALELNVDHVRALRRKFPGLEVYHDSAERMADYLALHGKKQADCVISGLPWALLSNEQQTRLLTTIHESLAPGGVFVAFAYAHARWMARARDFRGSLQARFARVEISPVVWGNLPPAFVYRCAR